MNTPTVETLFQELMSKMNRLNTAWNDYHKGELLSHFDGCSEVHYLSSTLIGEAIEVIKILHSKEPHEDLTDKINSIARDLSEIVNCFHEYLDTTPDNISFIPHYVEKFFREYAVGKPLTVEDLTKRIDFMETAPMIKPFFLNE